MGRGLCARSMLITALCSLSQLGVPLSRVPVFESGEPQMYLATWGLGQDVYKQTPFSLHISKFFLHISPSKFSAPQIASQEQPDYKAEGQWPIQPCGDGLVIRWPVWSLSEC